MNRNLLLAALVLGTGIGGLVDGLVLHQVIPGHNLIMLLTTAAGIALLFRCGQMREPFEGPVLGAGVLAGWGNFNFFEGLIDHQLLGLHHIHAGASDQFVWDLAFLGTGPILWALAILMLARHYTDPATVGAE
jgi:uncharacterized membrane protein